MAKELYLKTASGYEPIGEIVDSPATTSDIPTKVSQLDNDKGYLVSDDVDDRFTDLDVAISNRYTKNNTYNRKEVDNLVNSALSGSMHYWNGGVTGGSPGSTESVVVTRLYPPSAKLNDSVIVIDKDSSGRGTLTITWYLVTDIDGDNVQLTCQKNYYSYDNPSSGKPLGTIGGSTFSMGGSLGLKTVNGNSLVGSGNIDTYDSAGIEWLGSFDTATCVVSGGQRAVYLIVQPYENASGVTVTSVSSGEVTGISALVNMWTMEITPWRIYIRTTANELTGLSPSTSTVQIKVLANSVVLIYRLRRYA